MARQVRVRELTRRYAVTFLMAAIVVFSATLAPVVITAQSSTPSAWNPAVQCTATLTTIEQVIGNQSNANGGATFEGGGFKPGIPNKRSLSPPCYYGSPPNPTFVEIHNVMLTSKTTTSDCKQYSNGYFCDTFFNIASSGYSTSTSCPACYMHRIHVEIDQAWKSAGIAPPIPANSTTTQIDVQGFVYWDHDHTDMAGHSYSGWELHPLAAWRVSSGQSFGGADTTAPSWPAGSSLSASNVGATSLTLTWTAATDNVGVASYRIYRGTSIIATVPGNARTYNVTGLTSGTTYTFTVQAGDSAGNWSTNGPSTTVTTSTTPDFTITVSPATQSMPPGGSGTYTVWLKSLNGFSGTVTLTTSSSPDGLTSSANPSSITVSPGATVTSTLTVNSNTIGYYTITVTATSGSLSHSTAATMTVTSSPDFSISANPNSMTVQRGSSGTSTITVTGFNNFSGTVNLKGSVTPAGLAWSLNPVSVTLTSDGSGTSTLTVSTNSTTTTGSYTIVVTGTSGSLSHSNRVVVYVTGPPNFSMSSSPSTMTIQTGNSGSSTITLKSLNSFSGTVTLSASVSPAGPNASLNPSQVVLAAGGTGTSKLTVTVASTVASGNYTVTVTGTNGSLTRSVKVIATVVSSASTGDFGMSASPSSMTFEAGSSGTSSVTITSSNGFNGTVTLSGSGPSGMSFSFSPASVTGSGSSTVTISVLSTVAPATYTATVTGKSGSITHSIALTVTVTAPAPTVPPDFSISASPTSLTIPAGSSGSSIVSLTSLNGFAGTMNLKATVSGPISLTSPSASLSPTDVTLSSGGTSTSTLTVSTSILTLPGTYTIVVTATDGTITHSVSVQVIVTLPLPLV